MKKFNGFTLIEMIMVVMIITILSVMGIDLVYNLFKVTYQEEATSDVSTQTQYAMWRMNYDIRSAKTIDVSCGSGLSSLTFTDLDDNSIIYNLSGNDIQRNGVDLANNISALAFACVDSDGNVTTINSNAKYIMTELTATNNGVSQSLRSSVYLRNKI